MYIHWRSQAIASRRTIRYFRHMKVFGPWMDHCWFCPHTRPNRHRLTPRLRLSGQGRDIPEYRPLALVFPFLHSCCLQDGALRAAWWFAVEQILHQEPGLRFEKVAKDLEQRIADELQVVIARPPIQDAINFEGNRLLKYAGWLTEQSRMRLEAERLDRARRQRRSPYRNEAVSGG